MPQLIVLESLLLDFSTQLSNVILGLAFSLNTRLTCRVIRVALGVRWGAITMTPPQVLVQVLLAREAFARVPLAGWMRAVERVLGPPVLCVNLALMTQKTTRISKARKLFTTFRRTFIGPIVLVHVFTT